jgi:SsrA-binding protein
MSKQEKKHSLSFQNKRVYFDYNIFEKFEAGIVLTGTEVKSIRESKVSLNGAFCLFNDKELFLKGSDVAAYKEGSYMNHDPKRDRKLLLHRKELNKLKKKLEEKGLTIVPIRLYSNEKGMFKIEIGLAKGRKAVDKRNYIKDREIQRELKEY